MLDEKITGSYLRDLKWTSNTPQENERVRQQRTEEIKSRSLIAERVQLEHAELEVGLVPEDDHILAWYQVLDLDGEWPGGDYVMRSLEFVFQPDSLGARIDAEMLPGALHGFETWKREWGLAFPRFPLVRRLGLLPGEYEFRVKIRGEYAQESTTDEAVVGQVSLPQGLCFTGYGPANDLQIRWADFDLYADHLSPPPTEAPTPAGLAPYFGALDEAIEHVRRWHYCPRTTDNWYDRRTPHEGYVWNERYLGFYLAAFVPAYLLTGEPRYFQMCEYLYNTILHNIFPTFWGGPAMNQATAGGGENLLFTGIIARAVIRFAKMMGDPELCRPFYEMYAAWPRDKQHNNRLINVVFPDLTDQRLPFVYNQVMSSVSAVWVIGEMFEDDDLTAVAEQMWREEMRPGLQEGGYWFYTQERENVTQHYDLVQKSDASLLLEYDRWTEDDDFMQVMRQSMDYALSYYATEVKDMLVWQPFYNRTFESTLAVGKAGMALEVLTRLCEAGRREYAEPARKTARFIEHMRDWPDLADMWPCSWMGIHVIAPLLEAALAGIANV